MSSGRASGLPGPIPPTLSPARHLARRSSMPSRPSRKFNYTPIAGTVLSVGQGQVLSVTFNPTDTADYTSVTATATINVVLNSKDTPVLTWANPADISYGTALGSGQLDATASFDGTAVAGTFTYTPAVGAVLSAGQSQTLVVSFTPNDTVDFNNATASVVINVRAPGVFEGNRERHEQEVYGQPVPGFSVTYNGLVNGDTASSLGGTLSCSTAATAASDVGSWRRHRERANRL